MAICINYDDKLIQIVNRLEMRESGSHSRFTAVREYAFPIDQAWGDVFSLPVLFLALGNALQHDETKSEVPVDIYLLCRDNLAHIASIKLRNRETYKELYRIPEHLARCVGMDVRDVNAMMALGGFYNALLLIVTATTMIPSESVMSMVNAISNLVLIDAMKPVSVDKVRDKASEMVTEVFQNISRKLDQLVVEALTQETKSDEKREGQATG